MPESRKPTKRASASEGGPRPAGRTLVVIGGREDPRGAIMTEVVRNVPNGKLVIATAATHYPDEYFEVYERAFMELGLSKPAELRILSRADAMDPKSLAVLDDATGVFFTGGDQVRITSQLGDTPVEKRIREIYEQGGVVAGTSAGAAALCGTMLASGKGFDSSRGSAHRVASGLGLLRGIVIDQHFSQRGRMARLLGAVARNPRQLGVGIDEDTAIVVKAEQSFYVTGTGAVYVIDASGLTHSNVADELDENDGLSVWDVRVHVLARGDRFDLNARRPLPVPEREERRLERVQEGVESRALGRAR